MRALLACVCLIALCGCVPREITLTRSRLMMGHIPVNLSIRCPAKQKSAAIGAGDGAYALAQKIESEISEYQKDSQVSCLNQRAGKALCPLSQGTLDLLRRAEFYSRATDRAFDLRFASLTPKGASGEIETLESPPRGKLERKDTRIGVGAIGKGWIIDQMVEYLKGQGFPEVLIDAGGHLRAVGGPWKIAIQVPEASPGITTSVVEIHDESWSTSGLYEQGHHILDPRTRKTIDRRGSVTVRAPDLTTADALDTGFFVLGEEKSREYLAKFPGISMIWTDPDGATRTYPAGAATPAAQPVK
ncbi:MAG: FAD:protein FMN transferase [Deltaproteobacteria bacterium]|nr:FAD:protein FMN transferase [Deltaproteobacteria bacterium]